MWDEMQGLQSGQKDNSAVISLHQHGPRGERMKSVWENKGERFTVVNKGSEHQFAQLYFCRLNQLAPKVQLAVEKKWPDAKVVKILDVREKADVVVIGTLFKDMKLKPSILEEYTRERGLATELTREVFCSNDDKLVIEDENARMSLSGAALPVGQLVTGVVLAVRGSQAANGCFEVTGICFPADTPQSPLPSNDEKYVAIISGIGASLSENCPPVALDLAIDFLNGSIGNSDSNSLAEKIVRIVLAGGTLGRPVALAKSASKSLEQMRALEPLKTAAMHLVELASSAQVDVMPGKRDPATFALPQQPMNRRLFGAGANCSRLTMVSNPYEFEVDGTRFLGTSGQNVEDIARYSTISDRLKLLESCVEWKHLAPTAPDTLMCYPLNEEDPFVISELPHIFFAGNQPKFETSYVQVNDGNFVRLICIPVFAKTSEIVLVNLKNLKCHTVKLDTTSLSRV